MYSNAEFDADSDFAVKHTSKLSSDQAMAVQRENAQKKAHWERRGLIWHFPNYSFQAFAGLGPTSVPILAPGTSKIDSIHTFW